jgi:hypothetical protein
MAEEMHSDNTTNGLTDTPGTTSLVKIIFMAFGQKKIITTCSQLILFHYD